MRRQRLKLLVALPAVVVVAWLAPSTASAQESENASCVAQFVHGPPGPPGVFQAQFHLPRFGQNVSSVAHIPAEECPV